MATINVQRHPVTPRSSMPPFAERRVRDTHRRQVYDRAARLTLRFDLREVDPNAFTRKPERAVLRTKLLARLLTRGECTSIRLATCSLLADALGNVQALCRGLHGRDVNIGTKSWER